MAESFAGRIMAGRWVLAARVGGEVARIPGGAGRWQCTATVSAEVAGVLWWPGSRHRLVTEAGLELEIGPGRWARVGESNAVVEFEGTEPADRSGGRRRGDPIPAAPGVVGEAKAS